MATEVEDAHLTELLLTQLLNSKELKEQITQFRKRDPDNPKRCYGTLVDAIDEHLLYQQELKNRNDQTRPTRLLQDHRFARTGSRNIAETWSVQCLMQKG